MKTNLFSAPRLICCLAALSLASVATPAQEKPPSIPPPASGEDLPVPGRPVAADHSQLSEHNIQWMQTQPPQVEAEFLLGAAINHDHGATDWINKLVDGWYGKIKPTQRFDDLQDTALYSNDLRVRAAAIEMNLAAFNLSKTDDTADKLIATAEARPGNRPFASWELGMLANRGVEPEKIHELLVKYMHDPNQETRFWAVEGDAHLGTDETIKDFLDVLRNDPSMDVRERAGCGLAKSGMLTRAQRMNAVPGLIDLAYDNSLNATTREWVFQALREITNQHIPDDPATWHNWYDKSGAGQTQEFRKGDQWSVLGNN
ncbi:MAG TPA: HEAT repeat domain-containing protein [Terriglobales bacterium]